MQKLFTTILLSIFGAALFQPASGPDKPITIKNMSVEVKAFTSHAVTNLSIELYNPNDQQMDGELLFTIHEGQVINGFTLDIEGKQRQGVIVEKSKGRMAYETVVNQRIDPGLVENIGGNNYRLRVYPVPAHGMRKVTLSLIQELLPGKGGLFYELPLTWNVPVEQLEINIQSFSGSEPIALSGFIENEIFNSEALMLKLKDLVLSQSIGFFIPVNLNKTLICVDDSNRFFARMPFTEVQHNGSGSSLSILWDASSSGQLRDREKEFAFIKNFIIIHKPRTIKLVVFSNEVNAFRQFQNVVAADSIIRFLKDQPFDGATDFNFLAQSRFLSSDNLLFSDGLQTMGATKLPARSKIHVIQSASSSNAAFLRELAFANGGHYIDLQKLNVADAINQLEQHPFQYVKFETKNLNNVAAEYNEGYVTVCGNLVGDEGLISLQLPGNSKQKIFINKKQGCNKTDLSVNHLFSQIRKLQNSSRDLNGVQAFAKSNGLVSSFTSLIVLDNLSDYIRFNIMPPPDLLEAYHQNMIVSHSKVDEEKEDETQEHLEEMMDDLKEMVASKQQWWNKKFPLKKRPTQQTSNSGQLVRYQTPTPRDTTIIVRMESQAIVAETVVVQDSETEDRTTVRRALTGSVAVVSAVPGAEPSIRIRGFSSMAPSNNLSISELQEVVVNAVSENRSVNASIEFDMKIDSVNSEAIFSNKDMRSVDHLIASIKKKNPANRYAHYLVLKQSKWHQYPQFYMEMADLFHSYGMKKISRRILSNLCELELENHQLLRAMAYQSESHGDFKTAVEVYRQVFKIKEEEPQSARDLAMALHRNGQHQEAVELLYQVLLLSDEEVSDRFEGIKEVVLSDFNNIIASVQDLDLRNFDRSVFVHLPVDLRVVIDWNKDQTDIDLIIKEPGGDSCFYKNKNTRSGGSLSEDMTEGYGPEAYMIRKAIKGKYEIWIDYFGDGYQKQHVPAVIKLSIYRNFGRPDQTLKVKIISLDNEKERIKLDEIIF
jgi:hypothetical protein